MRREAESKSLSSAWISSCSAAVLLYTSQYGTQP
jgi:hypothetical protein